MTRVAPLLPTFSRGEVSPLMYGRSDIEPYQSCLAKCRNAWVRPFGAVSRISGTEYIAEAKKKCRLLKFSYSSNDSYIIECGAGYFRFYRDGYYIVGSNDQPYEIANPFTEEQLDTIQYLQIDDVVKIVYKDDVNRNNKPLELIRYGATNWVLRETQFVNTPYLDENLTNITITPSDVQGNGITLTASGDIFNAGQVGYFFYIGGLVTIQGIEKQGYVKITGVSNARTATANVMWKLSGTEATIVWAEGAFSKYRGFPSSIGMFDGRLYYARTPTQPRNVYGSRPYSYENFTPAVKNEANGGINIELANNSGADGSDIQWIIGENFILVGTYGGEFVLKWAGDEGITTTNIHAKQRSNWGVESIQPIIMGNLIHFIQRSGKKVRQYQYDYYLDAYKAVDVSLFSEHLFEESPLKAMAHMKNPDNILWAVRKDGKVICLTLETDQQIQAWALQEFNGVVEDIQTVPSIYNNGYDDVYIVIRRRINGVWKRYIERFVEFITPEEQEKCWYVRSGLYFDAYEKTYNCKLTLSEENAEGYRTATTENSNYTFTIESEGNRIKCKDGTIWFIEEYMSANTALIRLLTGSNPNGEKVYNGSDWGVSVRKCSNLNHIEGETVQILADGAVHAQKKVVSGEIFLDNDFFYIIAGLPYRTIIETMPLEQGSQNGTAVGKRKRINEMAIRVHKTLGAKVGSSLQDLTDLFYREPLFRMGEYVPLRTGVVPNIKLVQSGWSWESSLVLEQSQPLPLTVLAIAPMMNEQDK